MVLDCAYIFKFLALCRPIPVFYLTKWPNMGTFWLILLDVHISHLRLVLFIYEWPSILCCTTSVCQTIIDPHNVYFKDTTCILRKPSSKLAVNMYIYNCRSHISPKILNVLCSTSIQLFEDFWELCTVRYKHRKQTPNTFLWWRCSFF